MSTPTPNIFLSWSGDLSQQVALLLRDWVPNVVREATLWVSTEDIAKGSVWNAELNGVLAKCRMGVVVLTADNQTTPWVLFEAGCIFKAMEQARVCTLLCGLTPPLTGPLGQFQATRIDKKDVQRLVRDIDNAVNEGPNPRLAKWFDQFYPELESGFKKIMDDHKGPTPTKQPSQIELLGEILTGIRDLQRSQGKVGTSKTVQDMGGPVYRNGIRFRWMPDATKEYDTFKPTHRALLLERINDIGASKLNSLGEFSVAEETIDVSGADFDTLVLKLTNEPGGPVVTILKLELFPF